MQNNTGPKISEARYIRNGHREQNEKKRVHKMQRIVSSAVVVFCFAFLVFGGVRVVSSHTSAFQLVVEGEVISTLPTEKEAKAAIVRYLEEQSELLGFEVVCGDSVIIERVSSRDAVYSGVKDAVSALTAGAKVLARAVAVCVNGSPVMYVANEEDARIALEQAKAHYGKIGADGVEDITVLEQVGVISSNVELEQVFGSAEAANMLLFGKPKVEYHFVETTDETFEYIANRYGLKVEDIREANPGADSTNMALGEAILLTKVSPLISVQMKRIVVSLEETSFETEQRDNYDIPRGERRVVEAGVPGEDEVTTEVIERNGVVVAQNRISSVTLVEPVTRVEERGVRMIVASRAYTGNMGNGILGWPYDGQVSSRYGYRSINYHTGIDILGPVGSPVVAAEDGVVVFADWYASYGNLIRIDHGGDLQTWYAHLKGFSVNVGDEVKRGDMIGAIGMTGRTTGAHVHLEVRIDGQHYNPLQFLGQRQGEEADEEESDDLDE